jgi:hypothetical protein
VLALLVTLFGFALVESLNVLNLGLTSAIVYDSRLHRRSPLPGGLSFIAGLFAATVAVGIVVVLGVSLAIDPSALDLTPRMRYRGELVIGLVLVALARYPVAAKRESPRSALAAMRRRPWVLACGGAALGVTQAATDVMYLAALAMLAAHLPRPSMWQGLWPAIVAAYCAIELWPPLLVLFLATRRCARARLVQRSIVRVITRYGPQLVRAMCLAAGVALVVDSLRHSHDLW